MDSISLGCCLLAFLLYYNTLDAGFVYDDRRAILNNPDLLPTSSWISLLKNDFWGTPLSDSGSHGSYRPLCVFTFRINYILGGFQPWGYHLVNVLLHVLATGLVVRVARTILPPGSGNVGPAAAGLLFASHPIHTEAVAGIVGRADLAACNFYLLAFLIYIFHVKYRDNICLKTNQMTQIQNNSNSNSSSTLIQNFCACCNVKKFTADITKNIRKDSNLINNNNIDNNYNYNLNYNIDKKKVGSNNNTSKYQHLADYVRKHVANSPTTNNDYCCTKHNPGVVQTSNESIRSSIGVFDQALINDSDIESATNNHVQHSTTVGNGTVGTATTKLWWCRCNNKQGAVVCVPRALKQWLTIIICILCATAAVFSKETGISVLVVCILYDVIHTPFRFSNKKQLRSLLLIGIVLFVLIILRFYMASGVTPTFATADNPTAKASSIFTRFFTFLYLPTFNFYLLLCPTVLSFDWSMDAIPRIHTLFDIRNIFSLTFYAIFYKVIRMAVMRVYSRNHNSEHNSNSHNSHRDFMKRTNNKFRRKEIVQTSQSVTTTTTTTSIEQQKQSPVCPCSVCRYGLSENQHSQLCRTKNNNNNLPSSNSTCICNSNSGTSNSSKSVSLPPSKLTVILRETKYNNNALYNISSSTSKEKVKNPYATILLACAFLALPFLPATNLFFYVGFVVAERVLYLPSVGYCLLLGLGISNVWRVKKYWRYTCVCLVLLIILFCIRTIRRNFDWRDEESLYKAAIHINPPKAYGNLGSVLSSQGRTVEAEWAYRKALEYRSNMADVHYNLGILLQGQKQYTAAIRSYQKAIHFRPSLALAYVNLGGALVAAGRCQEAVAILRQGSQLDGTGLKDRRTHEIARVSALLQLGSLYADQGRLQRALAVYREALHTMPDYYPPQGVYNLLGETLARLHQFDEAERWYQAALQAQPDHVPAHITYGKLLAKNSSRIMEAEHWFRKAQRLAPIDPSVYHHYGEFLASLQRYNEAACQYVRAAELRPDNYELVVAAATALRQADRKSEAEHWYRMAVQLRPLDARGHTNLGAILHLNGKYNQAAESYKEALRLQPDDYTTLKNLHKLYSIMS